MTAMSFSIRTPAALAASAALLAGCAAVGPDYKGPPVTAPAAVAAGQFHRAAAAEASPAPPPARWWPTLGDAELTRLIDQALAASPTVREAEARVRSARASLSQSRAKLLPSGGADAMVTSAAQAST